MGSKSEIRREHRSARRAHAPRDDGANLAHQFRRLLERLSELPPATVAGFLPLPGEPSVLDCLVEAHRLGSLVVVPRTLADHRLEWIAWYPGCPTRPDRHGLTAPVGPAIANALDARPTVLLVPALAVDAGGTRVGHGAGYYDRALAGLRRWPDGPLRIAVVHPEELIPAPLPAQPHDEPVDVILTTVGWIEVHQAVE